MSFFQNVKRFFKSDHLASSIIFQVPGQAVWSGDSYKDLSEEGYKKNVYVNASIRLVAMTAAGIPWKLFQTDRRGELQELLQHNLLTLINKPNPVMGRVQFFENAIGFLLISGNTFIQKVGPDIGPPGELWLLRPDRMQVIPGDKINLVQGYKFGIGSDPVTLEAKDILHLKKFNPLDDFNGLSPIRVAARSIDQNNEAKEWNVSLLQNSAKMSGAFSVKGQLDDEQRKILKQDIEDRHTGSFNAGKPLLLEGDMSWFQMGITPIEMDWLESQKMSAKEIALIFGVPSELIGDSDNKTYSNFREARRALYDETIIPLLEWIKWEFNNWLVPLFGENLLLDFDISKVHALQEDTKKLFDRITTADWLTINEKRRIAGFDETDGGDVILVPLTLVPLGSSAPIDEESGHLEEDEDEDDDDEEEKKRIDVLKQEATNVQTLILSKDKFETVAEATKWVMDHDFVSSKVDETEESFRFRQFPPGQCQTGSFRTIRITSGVQAGICRKKKSFNLILPDQKIQHWKTFDRRRFRFVPVAKSAVSKRINEERKIIANVIRKSTNIEAIEQNVFGTLDNNIDKWQKTLRQIANFVGVDFARATHNLIKNTKPEYTKQVLEEQWILEVDNYIIRESSNLIVGINDATKSRLRRSISAGVLEGEGIDAIAKRVDKLYLDQIIPHRSEVIARTEVIRASNHGSQVGAISTGLPLEKEWISTKDDRTRGNEPDDKFNHVVVNGQRKGMDQPFIVDGQSLKFPGDISLGASAGNVIQCRCTEGYHVIGET